MSESLRAPVAGRVGRAVSRVVRVLVGLGVLAAGVGIAGMLVATRPVAPRVSRPIPLLQVRTMSAAGADVPRVWEGYGTARAMIAAQVPAQVAGIIIQRPATIEPGMPVSPPGVLPEWDAPDDPGEPEAYLRSLREAAGESLIVQIDPSDYLSRYRSTLEQVRATASQLAGLDVQERRLREMVDLARQEREIQQRELARIIEASAQGGGNESEVERRRATALLAQRTETNLLEQIDQIGPRRLEIDARLRELRSATDVARENLSRTVVTSPIAGALQEVAYRVGDWAAPGSVIARVVDLSLVEVPLRMPMAAAPTIEVGDQAELRSDSVAGPRWSGRVTRLSPEGDPQTRTFTVFVEVRQDVTRPAELLRPGQFVVGQITTSRTWRVLLVPRRVIDEDHVYVAADAGPDAEVGARVARRVGVRTLFTLVGDRPELDAVETQWAAVQGDADLAEGAPVIVSNLDDLHDGLLVGVTGAVAPAGQARGGTVP